MTDKMKETENFLSLFARLDKMLQKGPVRLAIEGGCASGKTTLAKKIEQTYECMVFHMDDFFLRPEQRTPERYREAGGNVDRERFLEEVLIPLSKNQTVNYRRFDCSSFKIAPAVAIKPRRLTVVEGTYSMHPELAPYYDLSVFLNIPQELQKQRIIERNTPQIAKRFFDEWIPLEQHYFKETNTAQRCDITISICDDSRK